MDTKIKKFCLLNSFSKFFLFKLFFSTLFLIRTILFIYRRIHGIQGNRSKIFYDRLNTLGRSSYFFPEIGILLKSATVII